MDEGNWVKVMTRLFVGMVALSIVFVAIDKYKETHRENTPERRAEMIKADTELGLDECRDAILYLQMAGQERKAERRAGKLDEVWQNLIDAAGCFYSVDKWAGEETNSVKILDDLTDDLMDEIHMYEDMPYGEKVMKKSYIVEIQRIWDVIDIYYR